jgi:hypothetical protein
MGRLGAVRRWMYRSGRPSRVAAVLNRADASWGPGLWPKRLVTLDVRERRSGRIVSFPVVADCSMNSSAETVACGGSGSAARGRRAADPGSSACRRAEAIDHASLRATMTRYSLGALNPPLSAVFASALRAIRSSRSAAQRPVWLSALRAWSRGP